MQLLVWTILSITCWAQAYPYGAEDFDDVQGKLLPPDYSETENNNYHDIHARFNKPAYEIDDNVQDLTKLDDNQVDNGQLTENPVHGFNPVDVSHPGDSAYDGFQSIDNHYTNIKPNENPDKNIDVYYSEDEISDTTHENSSRVVQPDDNDMKTKIKFTDNNENNVESDDDSNDELLLHGVNCLNKLPKSTCQILRNVIKKHSIKEEDNKITPRATYIPVSPNQISQQSAGSDGGSNKIRNTINFMWSTTRPFNNKLLLLQSTSNDL